MKKLYFTLTFIITLSTLMHSQNDWRNGYIIKQEGDTIFGWIDYRDSRSNSKQCFFKKNKEDKPIVYYPEDIFAYRFTNGKFFVSKSINDKNVQKIKFLEFMLHGRVDLYHYQDENDHYLMQKDSVMQELKNSEIIIPASTTDEYGRQISAHDRSVNRKEYIGQLSYMLQDANMQTDIQSSSLEAKSLMKVAKKYHRTVCSDEQCIIYEKSIKPVKWNVGFYTGISMNKFNFGGLLYTKLGRGEFIGGRVELEGGLIWEEKFTFSLDLILQHYSIYDLTIQEINTTVIYGNTFLNTNIKSGKSVAPGIDFNTYALKVPIATNYIFSKTKWRPYIGTGFNNIIILKEKGNFNFPFYKDFYKSNMPVYSIGFLGRAGCKFMLGDKHFLSCEFNYEYSSSLNINEYYRLTNNSFSLMLGYSF